MLRAKTDDVADCVRAVVAESDNVVRFNVSASVFHGKSGGATILAVAIGSQNNIVPHHPVSLIGKSLYPQTIWRPRTFRNIKVINGRLSPEAIACNWTLDCSISRDLALDNCYHSAFLPDKLKSKKGLLVKVRPLSLLCIWINCMTQDPKRLHVAIESELNVLYQLHSPGVLHP